MSQAPQTRTFSLIQEAPIAGQLDYCEGCFPNLGKSPVQLSVHHLRRDYPGGRDATVWDGDTKLEQVEEVFLNPRYPGLVVREYLLDFQGKHVLCRNHATPVMMRRIRYVPNGRLDTEGR